MTRSTIARIAALIVVLFSTIRVTHAAENDTKTTTETHNVVVVDFQYGSFIGAMAHLDGDSYTAISFKATSGDTFEDMFSAYGDDLALTLTKDDRGSIVKAEAFSTEYNKVIELTVSSFDDSAHIVGYCTPSTNNDYTVCQLDGAEIQAHGVIVNGEINKLRGANPFSVNGFGWLLQNGNLISYAVENGETRVYTTYLSTVLR